MTITAIPTMKLIPVKIKGTPNKPKEEVKGIDYSGIKKPQNFGYADSSWMADYVSNDVGTASIYGIINRDGYITCTKF